MKSRAADFVAELRLKGGSPFGLRGLTLLTGDGEPIADGALVVGGDKILDVGPSAVVAKRFANVRFVDAANFVACPGLVNAHVHSAMGFFRGLGHDQEEMIERFLFPAEKSLTAELLEPLSYSYLVGALKSGVTTVGDHYYFVDGVARAVDRLGMRGVVGETVADLGGAFPGRTGWDLWRGQISHWPHSARVTPAVAPHAADTVSSALLKELAQYAKKEKLPLHMHLSQSKGERQRVEKREGMSPVAYAESCGALTETTLAVHLVATDQEDWRRLAATGVTAGICPASQIIFEALAPLAGIFAAGVPVAVGTDCAASNDGSDLLAELRLLGLLAKDRGVPAASRSPLALLAAGTRNGAAALGLKNVTGVLAKGLKADFVLLERDVASEPMPRPDVNLIYSMASRQVRHVMIDGEWALLDGKLARAEEADLGRAYGVAVAEIRRRIGI